MAFQRGTGFVGLQQYLNANQAQAQSMGNRLADDVEKRGNEAMGAIDAQRAVTGRQIEAGTPTYNLAGLDPDEREYARTVATRGYTGPQDMGDTTALASQAQSASEQANLGATEAGRAVLLAQQAKGPYSLGARTLDAYLAGRGAGGRLEAAQGRFGDLQKYLTGAQQQVADQVSGAKAQTATVQGQFAATPQSTYYPTQAPQPTYAPGVGGQYQRHFDNVSRENDLRRRGLRP